MICVVLVSISSLAFAVVTFWMDSPLSFSSDNTSTNDAICLNPAYASHTENWQGSEFEGSAERFEKVQLTSFPGSIRRVTERDNIADRPDKQNTLWNPLAKVWLTTEQVQLLKIAFDIAYQDGGLQHAELIQGMLLQESLAGLLGRIGHMTAPVGKRSYGVMQVKVTAAEDVLGRDPYLGQFDSDNELITNLIVDDEFNIRVASKLFLYLRAKTKTDDHALLAYNVGLRASRRYKNYEFFRYVKKVKDYSKQIVSPFNEKFNGKIISKIQPAARKVTAS